MTTWLVQSLSGSTLLLVAVMIVRPLLLPRLGPRLTYGLWLLPLIRLALPAMPVWTVPESAVPAGLGHGLDVPAAVTGASDAVAAYAIRADEIALALILVWAVGAGVHLGWRLADYARFVQRAQAASTGPATVREGVAIWTSAFVSGPVAAGIWKKRIFLPLDFEVRFDAEQRRLILAHELAHHRRRDIAWNFAALIMVSVHWFNPLAHHAYRLYRLDQELACDADVVAGSPALRLPYGRLLTQAVCRGDSSPLCSLSGTALLKRRLAALAGAAGPSSRIAQVAMAPFAIAGLLLTAPVSIGAVESAGLMTAPPPATKSQPLASPAGPQPSRAPVYPLRVRLPVQKSPAVAEASQYDPPTTDVTPSSLDAHLAARREAGLLRSRYRLADPARAALDRGRPVLSSPPTGT